MTHGKTLTRIYYVEADADGQDIRAIPITVRHGKADLSRLPPEIRRDLQSIGASNMGIGSQLFPEHGAGFLEALVNSATPYRRFRVDVNRKLLGASGPDPNSN